MDSGLGIHLLANIKYISVSHFLSTELLQVLNLCYFYYEFVLFCFTFISYRIFQILINTQYI